MTQKTAPDAVPVGNLPGRGPSPARAGAASESKAARRDSPVNDFLLKLVRAMKGAQFYPENHPAFGTMLEKCSAAGAVLLAERAPLVFEIRSQRVHFDGQATGAELPEVRILAMACTYRRVKKFQIQAGVLPKELEGFIRTLVTDPGAIQTAGGVEKVLFTREVRNVWANEINYQDLLYGDQAPAVVEEFYAPEETLDQPDLIEDEPLVLPPDSTATQQELVKLLLELDAAIEAAPYVRLVGEVIQFVQGAEPPLEHDDVYRALRVLSIHAEGREDRDPSISPHALRALRALSPPPAVRFLVDRLMRKSHTGASKLMGLLWQIGATSLPPLVEQLARAKTIRQRRLLADTIAGFGDAAIPHLLKPLADERWFVVRNAVTILGDIGDPLAIPALEPVASHRDPRIPKEVMKSLGRIGTSDARSILERHLKHASGDTQLLAAFALGLMRDPEAVPALVAALARPLVLARSDLQREVIKALAKIGTPAVVPVLGRIFRRRALVSRRKTEDLREVAAQALARINSEPARALLAQGLSSHNPKVAAICRAALSEPTS